MRLERRDLHISDNLNNNLKKSIKGDFLSKSVYFEYEQDFEMFLNSKGLSELYIKDVLRVGKKFFESNFNNLDELVKYYLKNESAMKYNYLLFRNLFQFWEEKELLSIEIISFLKGKLKRKQQSNKVDVFVPAITDIDKLSSSVEKFSKEAYIFIRILLESGLRISEVRDFLLNLDKNKFEIDNKVVVYPLFRFKGNKNSYYLFMQLETYRLIIDNLTRLQQYDFSKVQTYCSSNNLIALKYVRKYQFTQMIKKGIDFEIANFIQGRASKNIGINHYLAKKEIALKEYEKILK